MITSVYVQQSYLANKQKQKTQKKQTNKQKQKTQKKTKQTNKKQQRPTNTINRFK